MYFFQTRYLFFLLIITITTLLFLRSYVNSALRHNLNNLYYSDLLITGTGSQDRFPGEVLSDIATSRIDLSLSHIQCRIQTLHQYDNHLPTESAFIREVDSTHCLPITFVSTLPVNLPIAFFPSNWPVFQRNNGELEFRRNSAIWGPIYAQKPGHYQVSIEARGLGPEPAQVRVIIGNTREVFHFFNIASTESFILHLSSGINWIELAYTNDAVIDGADRNLRLISVQVSPYDN
jgi:hypothetical protein